MDSRMKKLVAGVTLAGALTVGTAGVAVAAEGSGTTTDPSAQTAGRRPWLRHQLVKAAIGVVSDTLGVAHQELREALKGGQTINQYATSLGKDPQAVVDALTDAATTRLDQWVTDGRITQERADTLKSRLPARIDTLMNRQFGQHAAA
jgi:hypothetical protein